MRTRLTINGQEVANPASRIIAVIVAMVMLALLLIVLLPLIGFIIAIGAGLIGTAIAARAIGRRKERIRQRREKEEIVEATVIESRQHNLPGLPERDRPR